MPIFKFVIYPVLILMLTVILSSCGQDSQFDLKRVTFRVITPPDTGSVYITGNKPDLGNWEAGEVKLARESDTSWVNKFYFKAGETIEYKFTKGEWQSEALDSSGRIPGNSILEVNSDTVVTVYITEWAHSKLNGRIFISGNLILNNPEAVAFANDYRYHSGDNPDWKYLNYNDSEWPVINPSFYEQNIPDDWNGTGWFRIDLWVDSTLWGKTTAVIIDHLGASEVYFNEKLLFATGTTGHIISDFKPEQRRIWESLTWDNRNQQIIAVKYVNHNWREHLEKGFPAGFEIRMKDINHTLSSTYYGIRTVTNYQVLFTIIPLTLAVLHLFIFVFYPYDKQNLFYSLCLFAFATLSFSINQRQITTDVEAIMFYYSLVPISITLAVLFGLYTTYSGSTGKMPRRHYLFLLLAVLICSIVFIKPSQNLIMLIYSFMGLCLYEMARIIFKSRERYQSSVFIITGFFFLAVSVVYQILIDYGIVPAPAGFNLVYGYGVLALIFSMSMALSFNFGKTNKNLKEQLAAVEVLSRINLERERAAKMKEIERVVLEADNKRKTMELEEARKLQLSFLPEKLPDVKDYSIAVFMKTATEVGGDYYDFHTTDGTLTAVIGDATGHGARAGTMVSAVKSLFHVLADEPEPLIMIRKYTNALKSMNLHNLYMGFSVSKFNNGILTYSNAGMPPVLIYRCSTGMIEEVVQKTMPLGSFIDFPYVQEDIKLSTGDTILFLSDGFTEAFSPEEEIFGLEKAKEAFLSCAKKSDVNEIVSCLKSEVEKWQGGEPPKDDITFVVIRKES